MTPGMVADRLGVPKLVGKLPRRPVSALPGPFGPGPPPWALGPGPMLTYVTLRGPWALGPVVESYKRKTRILGSYKRKTRILESYIKKTHQSRGTFLNLIKGKHISLGGHS